jgi:hypothetical protein
MSVATRLSLGLAVVAVSAGVAASVALGVGATATKVVDATYSCRVQEKHSVHFVDLDVGVTYPPLDGVNRPAHVSVTTEPKTVLRYGKYLLMPQVYFDHVKDSLDVDLGNCRRSRSSPALTHAALGGAQTATPNKLGDFQQRCTTKKRVLVRYRITMSNGTPERALLAVRNDGEKSRPIAFFRWAPRKITGYLGKGCAYNPPGLG